MGGVFGRHCGGDLCRRDGLVCGVGDQAMIKMLFGCFNFHHVLNLFEMHRYERKRAWIAKRDQR